jgi:hypothetical protein
MFKDKSPFEFLVFNPRPQAQEDRFRSSEPANDSDDLHLCSSSEDLDRDESPPPPDSSHLANLSSVISQISIPKNPLSDIGDPSENRLLKITNSPTVGALTEVISKQLKLKGKGLSHFGSSEKLLLSRLFNLSVLDLSNNYIAVITDISQCPSITYLNLSSNLITDISPISSLLKLITFKAAHNKIFTLAPLESCERLQKIIIHNNSLSNFPSTIRSLKKLPNLKTLTIHSNPCINKTRNSQEKLLSSLTLASLDKKKLEDQPREYREVLQSKPEEKLTETKEESKSEPNKAVKLLERLRLEKFSNSLL